MTQPHHLIFISKHILGYKIMKGIMAGASSTHEQGVASFEYNAATIRQPFLFGFNRPLEDLADMLCDAFAGRTLSMIEIYNQHNVDTPYTERNYKDALLQMEATGRIVARRTASGRNTNKAKPSFGDNTLVTFPPKDNV